MPEGSTYCLGPAVATVGAPCEQALAHVEPLRQEFANLFSNKTATPNEAKPGWHHRDDTGAAAATTERGTARTCRRLRYPAPREKRLRHGQLTRGHDGARTFVSGRRRIKIGKKNAR